MVPLLQPSVDIFNGSRVIGCSYFIVLFIPVIITSSVIFHETSNKEKFQSCIQVITTSSVQSQLLHHDKRKGEVHCCPQQLNSFEKPTLSQKCKQNVTDQLSASANLFAPLHAVLVMRTKLIIATISSMRYKGDRSGRN